MVNRFIIELNCDLNLTMRHSLEIQVMEIYPDFGTGVYNIKAANCQIIHYYKKI